eukprot:GILI01017184.1.p1 GENE.GILI01017184.1~~GILI01017184.1.p1  ORF type:complete len:349 (+),score=44.07 GILI01017184.1:41-1048(+)
MDYLNDVARPGSAVDKIIAFSPGAAPSLLSFLCLPNCKDLWDAATLISEDRPRIADTAIVSLGLASADGVPTALGQLVAPLAVALECSLEAGCAAAMLAALGYPLVGAVIAMNFDEQRPDEWLTAARNYLQRMRATDVAEEDNRFQNVFEVYRGLGMGRMESLEEVQQRLNTIRVVQLATAVVGAFMLPIRLHHRQDDNHHHQITLPSSLLALRPLLLCSETDTEAILSTPVAGGHLHTTVPLGDLGPMLLARWKVNYSLECLFKREPHFDDTQERLLDILDFRSSFSHSATLIEGLEMTDANFKYHIDTNWTQRYAAHLLSMYGNASYGASTSL